MCIAGFTTISHLTFLSRPCVVYDSAGIFPAVTAHLEDGKSVLFDSAHSHFILFVTAKCGLPYVVSSRVHGCRHTLHLGYSAKYGVGFTCFTSMNLGYSLRTWGFLPSVLPIRWFFFRLRRPSTLHIANSQCMVLLVWSLSRFRFFFCTTLGGSQCLPETVQFRRPFSITDYSLFPFIHYTLGDKSKCTLAPRCNVQDCHI